MQYMHTENVLTCLSQPRWPLLKVAHCQPEHLQLPKVVKHVVRQGREGVERCLQLHPRTDSWPEPAAHNR